MEWLKIWDEGLPVVAKNANTKDLILSTSQVQSPICFG